MARVNICGFETGDFSECSAFSANGGNSVQTTTARSGGYAFRNNVTLTSSDFVTIQGIKTDGTTTLANVATAYCRFYFLFLTLPASASEEIFAVGDSSTGIGKFWMRISSSGLLSAWSGTNGVTQIGSTGATTLASNTWYRIEVSVGSGVSSVPWAIMINGVSEISGSDTLATANNNGTWNFGKVSNKNGNTVDFYFDDIAIDDAAYPGDGAIIRFDPTADVAKTNWTDQGAGTSNIFNSVDDFRTQAGHDTDTTYIVTSTSGVVTYTASFATMASKGVLGTVNEVKFVAFGRDTGTTLTWRLTLRPVSNTITSTALDGTNSYTMRAILYKASGGTDALTIANMDTCQGSFVHVQANARELRCTAMAIMVDCAPYSVANLTKGGSVSQPSAISNVNVISV